MSVKKRCRMYAVQGFTLVELVIIILIIGIITVIAMPGWQGNALGLQYEARRVLNDIRLAQALSMATGQRYRWVQTSSTTYQILNESGVAIPLPNGSTTMTLSNGSSFGTLTNLPNNLIAFDSQGTPYITSTYPGTALSATAVISMSDANATASVSIVANTGYGVAQ